MNEEQKEKWYNSFTREQLIERCKYLQRSCERKEKTIADREMEIADLESIIKEVREYIKENTASYYTDLEHTNEEFELIGDPEELLEILDKVGSDKD